MTFCDVNVTAHWLGINKANASENLFLFLGHYLGFILSATILSCILFYQAQKRYENYKEIKNATKRILDVKSMRCSISFYRLQKGEPLKRPKVLFPNVTRDDADKSIELLLKYLHNYGFYKFGVELTLVNLAILICVRKDAVSVVYIVWLCIILCVGRRTLRFIWPIFQYFVLILTVMQYLIMLNLPIFLQSCEYKKN